ncbi:MAG: lactate racemase domain-containing protein [Candidatus Thorarchaeota archaeon]
MKVPISYGDTKIDLDIPEKNLAGKIVPKQPNLISDTMTELMRVMENPHGPHLSELAKSKSVCVLVEDHTRDEPHWELLNAISPFLKHANRVQYIITTGSHEVEHPGNSEIIDLIKKSADDEGLSNYRIKINDCQDLDVVDLGKTSRGTPVIITSDAVGHDVYVPLADMKAHYFAGYSNALKDFLPGICAFETIEVNHAMALDVNSTFGVHPFHPDSSRRNNPLADDMREATEMITQNALIFTLSVISSGRKLVWADAGRLEPVIAGGIEILDETASFQVKPTSRIVVSPGGYPQDKSLYHAQRGLELTKNAVSDGGEILFLAECRDGVAPEKAYENFYKKLTAPLDEVIGSIKGRYHLYEHKAYKFAELLQRISALHMHTMIDQDTVESAHLTKVETPQDTIDGWISEDSGVQIMVLDKGNKLAVYSS